MSDFLMSDFFCAAGKLCLEQLTAGIFQRSSIPNKTDQRLNQSTKKWQN
jgi:activator of 2-hydroxyglutaryl-CoA dehydratase